MRFPIATVGLANGARLGICPLPGRTGAFNADMIEVLRWKPDVMVSMTELLEMQHAGAAALFDRLAEAGVRSRHLPIRDYNGPSGYSADFWPKLSRELHSVLDEGGAVLAHCYGGHGRSGMVVMRLLVERGEKPEDALERIRAVRPGAVEAPGQVAWAAIGGA